MPPFRDELSKSSPEPEKKTEKRSYEKVFVVRESYYTTLFEDPHLKSVYNIFMSIFIFITLDSISYDYFTNGRICFGLRTIKRGFGKLHIAILVWIIMQILVIGLYYALQAWARGVRSLSKKKGLQTLLNWSCVIGFAAFISALFFLGASTCLKYNLAFASSFALLMETFRFMMKTYAYVRSSVPKFLKAEGEPFHVAPISSYFYYLFAPTLLYRDSYPRTSKIRWKFIAKNALEMTAVIFMFSFIYERYVLVNFQQFGVEKITKADLLGKFFAMVLPCTMSVFGIAYLVLHLWFNITGEILRFGDRLFYKDWWTSPNYETYYRTWNIVVHEWFYEYVYKDCYKYVFKGSKVGSSLMVFLLSALMHEHVIGISIQMFYPVLFVFFGGSGVILFFITKNFSPSLGRLFVCFTLLIGSTFNIFFYVLEYFARANHPQLKGDNWIQEMIRKPVSWSYHGIV